MGGVQAALAELEDLIDKITKRSKSLGWVSIRDYGCRKNSGEENYMTGALITNAACHSIRSEGGTWSRP